MSNNRVKSAHRTKIDFTPEVTFTKEAFELDKTMTHDLTQWYLSKDLLWLVECMLISPHIVAICLTVQAYPTSPLDRSKIASDWFVENCNHGNQLFDKFTDGGGEQSRRSHTDRQTGKRSRLGSSVLSASVDVEGEEIMTIIELLLRYI